MIYLVAVALVAAVSLAGRWRLLLSEARGDVMAAKVKQDAAEAESRGFRQELVAVREQNIRLTRTADQALARSSDLLKALAAHESPGETTDALNAFFAERK